METTESRRRNDDTTRTLHDNREIIAEAQRRGLPRVIEERKIDGTFRAKIGGTTVEGTESVLRAIDRLRGAGILSADTSRLSDLFTDALEEVAPKRNFSELSTAEIALVARSFNDRKFSAQFGQ
jgi:hypothetical protein